MITKVNSDNWVFAEFGGEFSYKIVAHNKTKESHLAGIYTMAVYIFTTTLFLIGKSKIKYISGVKCKVG